MLYEGFSPQLYFISDTNDSQYKLFLMVFPEKIGASYEFTSFGCYLRFGLFFRIFIINYHTNY